MLYNLVYLTHNKYKVHSEEAKLTRDQIKAVHSGLKFHFRAANCVPYNDKFGQHVISNKIIGITPIDYTKNVLERRSP